MRRRHPRLRAIAVLLGLFSGALCVQPARADDITDQQQQVRDDLAEIQRLEETSAQLNEEYLGSINEQAALEAEIAAAQQQIDLRTSELAVLQTQLADVAIAQFTGGGGGFELFGDTSSATASLQRDQLVRAAVNAGAASTDDYDSLLDQLDSDQSSLRKKRERAEQLAQQAADALARTEQAGIDYENELAQDRAVLGDLLVQEEQRQQAAAAAEYAAKVAAKQAGDQAARDQAARDQAAHDQAARDQASRDQASRDQAAAAAANEAATTPSSQSDPPETSSAAPTSQDGASGGNGAATSTTVAAIPFTTAAPTTTDAADDDEADSSPAFASGGEAPDENAEDAPESSSDGALVTVADSSDAGVDGGASESPPPPVTSRALIAVAAARSQLGVPYKFARSSPGVAFDCSGLTAYAWQQAGVSIPHQSGAQFASTPHIAIEDIQPGDLLYFYSPISHVSIYIGNGQQIHAPAPGKFVEIANVNWGKLVGASRPG